MSPRAAFLALALAGCADNWIDPGEYRHDGQVMVLTGDRDVRLMIRSVEQIGADFAGTIVENPDRFAYNIDFPQYCLIAMPPARFPRDPDWAAMLWHELRHCAEGAWHERR